MRTTSRVRAVLTGGLSLTAVFAFAGCTSSGSSSESVFDARPGQCFAAPGSVKAELSNLSRVSCSKAHTQEMYAAVAYAVAGATSSGPASSVPSSSSGIPYPGADALDKYAQGMCAQRFTVYVGVDYLSSSLFFTYLLPSARSWEQNADRTVLCFITTTGGKLTSSVKNSRR